MKQAARNHKPLQLALLQTHKILLLPNIAKMYAAFRNHR